jgi:hypothetical protein
MYILLEKQKYFACGLKIPAFAGTTRVVDFSFSAFGEVKQTACNRKLLYILTIA